MIAALRQLHEALEKIQGPIDLERVARSTVVVDQEAEAVRGRLTGIDVDGSERATSMDVTQRLGVVHHGGDVTGYRSGEPRS